MKTYIQQLIRDLESARHFTHGGANLGKTSMERLSGLKKLCFPPAEKLSREQLQNLIDAMVALWESQNYMVNLPHELPVERKYQKLLDKWTDEIEYHESSLTGLMFCPENLDDCDMREFCGHCYEVGVDDIPVYNGIYDDDGNKIDRSSLPIPDLCLSCENFLDDDWEANVLCDLSRADWNEEEAFQCGAWRKRRRA